MGSLTQNKLGGISLIVGIPGATILWIVFAMILGGSIDPADFAAQAADNAAASTIKSLIWLLPPVLLVVALYGWSVVYENIKESGTGAAPFRLGLLMFGINVLGIIISSGVSQAGVWHEASGATLTAAASGIWTYTGIIGGAGAILTALALASRDDYNKIFAYIVAVVFLVNVIFNIIGWNDTSTWELGQSISGVCFVVIAAWSVTLGLGLLKKG